MKRIVTIYAASDTVRDGLRRTLADTSDLEVEACLSEVSSDPARLDRADLLVLCRDLSPVQRLRVLGRAWRQMARPRILFLDVEECGGLFTPEDGERALEAMRTLLDTSDRTAKLRFRPCAPEDA